MIYGWGNESDIAPFIHLSGKIESFEEWCTDWKEHYFTDDMPERGRMFVIIHDGDPIGAIAYNDIDSDGRVELDIWLNSESNCGKGFGTDAIRTLCVYLASEFGVKVAMMQPSARNPRAIRAYEKAGFVRRPATPEQIRSEWGGVDHHDSVLMTKQMSHTTTACSGPR
jgi:diamine N-acetyltransferase